MKVEGEVDEPGVLPLCHEAVASLFLPHRASDFPPPPLFPGGLCLADNCSLSQGEQVRRACPENPWLVFISYSFPSACTALGDVICNVLPAQVFNNPTGSSLNSHDSMSTALGS